MDDLKIYEEIIKLKSAGVPSALATVIDSAGSAPRKPGAKMLIRSDGSILGTIGGGKVELKTIESAMSVMREGRSQTLSFTLNEEYGYVCGGSIAIFIEPNAVPPRLLMIGAGHVGKAVASTARFAGFRVFMADDRPEYATKEQVPDAEEIILGNAAEAFERFGVDPATSIVITTTGFVKDFDAVRAALKTPARYIGVIGSKRKASVLVKTLTEEGYTPDELARVNVPMGIPIAAETPSEIAVSVTAQLVKIRRENAAKSVGDTSCRGLVAEDGAMQATPPAG